MAMRTTIAIVSAFVLVCGTSVNAQVDKCAELLRLSRTTSRTVMDRSQFTQTVDNFCDEARSARNQNRAVNLDLRVLGIGAGGGSEASTNSTFTKYCSEESSERRQESNYQQYLDGIDPQAYSAYAACAAAARSGVEFQLLELTRDELHLVVHFPTNDRNAQADMSWDAIGPVTCQWQALGGDGEVEAPQRRILMALERTRLTCERDSFSSEPVGEPDYVNVIRDGGDAMINVPWLKYNEQGLPYQTLEEIRQQLDREMERLRDEVDDLKARTRGLEQRPDTIFGDWERVVVSEVHRAESDGFLTAFSGGTGDIGAIYLETGESESRLTARNRGGQYEGAAIPVKRGHYYRVLMRRGSSGTVQAFWLPAGR